MSRVFRLIFVCSGNICRSPMAEGLAKKKLADAGLQAQTLSMGTLGLFGRPASAHAIEVCGEIGVDLTGHVSQGLSYGLLSQADLVLVMERAHKEFILSRRPELRNLRLLSSYDREDDTQDIADPIGGTREDYESTCKRISRAVDGLIRQLRLQAIE